MQVAKDCWKLPDPRKHLHRTGRDRSGNAATQQTHQPTSPKLRAVVAVIVLCGVLTARGKPILIRWLLRVPVFVDASRTYCLQHAQRMLYASTHVAANFWLGEHQGWIRLASTQLNGVSGNGGDVWGALYQVLLAFWSLC